MDIFKIKAQKNNHIMVLSAVRNGEGGRIIFGVDKDHITPMKIMNNFLEEEVYTIHENNNGTHLFIPQRHFSLWKEKTSPIEKYWSRNPHGIRLDIMKKET